MKINTRTPTGSPSGVSILDNYNNHILQCPLCGFEGGLHHDRVEVFERIEDALKGLHVTVTSPDVFVSKHQSTAVHRSADVHVSDVLMGNPSSRRNGITIHFWCEMCPKRSVLSLAQCKGETHIRFEEEL